MHYSLGQSILKVQFFCTLQVKSDNLTALFEKDFITAPKHCLTKTALESICCKVNKFQKKELKLQKRLWSVENSQCQTSRGELH